MQWLFPILLVFGVAALSVSGLVLIRRRVHYAALSKHNDIAGAVFSIIGTLLTVLLAFVVVIVWEDMGTAQDRVAIEAGVLGDLIRDAGFFSNPVRAELQSEFREYAQAVVDEEWPAMENGQSSQHVWDVLNRIFRTFSHIQPMSPREINVHAEMLTRINELSDHRRLRLIAADSRVPPLMWFVLIVEGAITICFTYFLGVERERSHILMTAALAVMIGLTLYLILAIDHPFSGALRVEPDAFRLVLDKVVPIDYTQ